MSHYYYSIILLIFMVLIVVWFKRSHKKIEEFEDEIEEDRPKIVIDHQKALCQSVRFAMRLKKRMRRFKEKKMAASRDVSEILQ